jgi:glucose/arabinose dehydrogenase
MNLSFFAAFCIAEMGFRICSARYPHRIPGKPSGMRGTQGTRGALVALAFAPILASLALSQPAQAGELPERFQEEVVLSGLAQPTTVQFAGDGRVFVAEKSGLVKVFDDLDDSTPTVFADLRTEVHNFWDRGLLGLALDPEFPAEPYVYVLYTYDLDLADPGLFPRWGEPGMTADGCPTPPGPTGDGCVVSGRLSRLQALGDVMTGAEQVLIEDAWCQQYPSHTVGSLGFGADGALYVSAGDGASFDFADYGQAGDPANPCGDPPGGVGGAQTPLLPRAARFAART